MRHAWRSSATWHAGRKRWTVRVDPHDTPELMSEQFASISNGREIEWEARNSSDTTSFASLRESSRIVEFNRSMQKGGGTPDAPERWGDLLLLEQIGRGGQAEVF